MRGRHAERGDQGQAAALSGAQALTGIGRNSLPAVLATAASAAGGLACSVLLARGLAPEEYGRYSYVIWLVGLLSVVSNLGMPNAAVRYLGEYGVSARGQRLYLGLVRLEALVAVTLASGVVVWGWFQGAHLPLACFAAMLLIPTSLGRLVGAAASGLQAYGTIALAQSICAFLQLALMAAALVAGGGLVGILSAVMVVEVLRTLLLSHGVNRHLAAVGQDAPREAPEWRRVSRFAGVVFLLALLDAIVWEKSEVFFLERFSTLGAIAVYSLSYGLAYMVMQAPVAISNLLLPVFAAGQGAGSPDFVEKGYYCATKYLALAVVPLGVLAMVLAPQLIAVLYGPAYAGAVPALRLLLAIGTVATFNRPISSVLFSAEKQNFVLGVTLALAALNLSCDLALIPGYGAVGAALANGITQLSGVLIGGYFVLCRLRYPFPWGDLLKIAASGGGAGALLHALHVLLSPATHALVCLLLFPPAFVVGLRALRPWNRDDERIFAIAAERCPPRIRWLPLLAGRWLGVAARG
jgi:O-antigen/teichoic acid export membrane protein